MSEVDSKELGVRIREARERGGLTQGELAGIVGLDRTAVNKIESGSRKVTALELSEIAHVLGIRMSSFFSDPVPALVSHRSNQGAEIEDSSVDRLLAGLVTDVELVDSLSPGELGLQDLASRVPGLPLPHPSSMSEAEGLASRARDLLSLDDAQPIHNLVERISTLGLLVFSEDLGANTADAGTVMLRHGGISLVNSHNKVGRRRLAAAHELGHYLVADEYSIDWRVADQSGDIEARLDRFARALLLPEPGIQDSWSRLSEKHELREVAVLLGSEFRVDMATLSQRLYELDLINGDQASTVRGVATTQADIIEFGLHIPFDLEATSMPVAYQKAVLRAFRDERISRERAIDLLRDTFNDSDLPMLRTRREDEIWTYVS